MYDDEWNDSRVGGGALHCTRTIPHGTHCDCRLLAEALPMDPRKLPYEYCRNVLQRRWRMTCRHGEVMPTVAASSGPEKWKDLGKMTPLNALLVKNA